MQKKGRAYAIVAYVLWGLFPIYWKLLRDVGTLQVIGHRILWSFVILMSILVVTRRIHAFRREIQGSQSLWRYFITAVLIGINWLVYVWAVNAGFVIEASLGYFINPLTSVLMAVLFLREHLRPFQWASILLASLGVLYLSMAYGRVPWIALTLALSFSAYGLIKKLSPLDALSGLTLETGILFIPALLYVMQVNNSSGAAFLRGDTLIDLLLIGAGAITAFTLYMFSSAARILSLTTLGLMEYIAPTLAFLLGVFIYREPFDISRLIGFITIWVALFLFVIDGFQLKKPALNKSIL